MAKRAKAASKNTPYRSQAERRWHELHPEMRHEPLKLRIGLEKERCWYCPDFMGISDEGDLVLIEVKGGHIRDSGRVKYRAAKRLYPEFRFEMWQEKKKKWNKIDG